MQLLSHLLYVLIHRPQDYYVLKEGGGSGAQDYDSWLGPASTEVSYLSGLPRGMNLRENDPGNDPGCTCGVLKYIAPREGSVALTPFYTKHKYDNPCCPVYVQGPGLD